MHSAVKRELDHITGSDCMGTGAAVSVAQLEERIGIPQSYDDSVGGGGGRSVLHCK